MSTRAKRLEGFFGLVPTYNSADSLMEESRRSVGIVES